ncbi:LysR family transcriptional regulator [Neobacillus pocheonensis]|uniref:LysR family transcriptional regulator n=1 Tax=Neobacillus pocheonensis TaxID=363869 RepID=A0ABT0WCT3_9BACI|nr:LysR family transcriptional regulator [Neobacillus pocheonensis]
MDYRDWEVLKVLYNQKNLTKAARFLFITQPAFPNRLKHMQEELGAKIVTRESRGVHFTPHLTSKKNPPNKTCRVDIRANSSQQSSPKRIFRFNRLLSNDDGTMMSF